MPSRGAGSFSIFPTTLRFDERLSAGSLRVSNVGDALGVFQVDPRLWTAADTQASTSDLILNPTVLSVAPGKQQVLRIGLARLPPAAVERSYRLYLQQVSTSSLQGGSGSELLLRLGVPVFVAPFQREPAQLHMRAAAPQLEGELLRLQLRNPGNVHQRLLRLRWLPGGDEARARIVDARPAYVLARAELEFALAAQADEPRQGVLELQTELGELRLAWDANRPG